jgi:hypothetical protein
VDAATGLGPREGRGSPRVDAIKSRTNLCGPRRFGVGVDLAFEALDQLAGERGPLFVRQSKRFDEELFGIHTNTLARHSWPNTGWSFCRAREYRGRGYIVVFQVGILRQDLVACRASDEQFENILYTDAQVTNARASTADVQIHGDAIQASHADIVAVSVHGGQRYGS